MHNARVEIKNFNQNKRQIVNKKYFSLFYVNYIIKNEKCVFSWLHFVFVNLWQIVKR